jgi:hypothetical protein
MSVIRQIFLHGAFHCLAAGYLTSLMASHAISHQKYAAFGSALSFVVRHVVGRIVLVQCTYRAGLAAETHL